LRNGEAQCFGSFEIDYKLVLSRRLHREIAWLLTFEDAIDVARGTTELVEEVGSVTDQPAGGAVER
jgi:hypothetical protein